MVREEMWQRWARADGGTHAACGALPPGPHALPLGFVHAAISKASLNFLPRHARRQSSRKTGRGWDGKGCDGRGRV